MKKILTGIAIAAFALVSNAATVDWSYNLNFMDANFMPVEGTLAFYLASDMENALSSVTIDADGNAIGTATGETGVDWVARLTISNFDEGGEWYKDYVFTMTIPRDGFPDTESSLIAYGDETIAGLTNDYSLDLYSPAADQGYTAVPEPTSGLLLLLGMAGLALRRKQA